MSEKKSTLVTNVPDFVKQWYKTTAEGKGGKMQSFAAMILTEYAIANGAKKLETNEKQVANKTPEERKLTAYEELQMLIHDN